MKFLLVTTLKFDLKVLLFHLRMNRLMASRKAAVAPLLTHWYQHSLVLGH